MASLNTGKREDESKTVQDCVIAYGDGFESARRLFERPHGEWIIIKSPLSNETIVKCDKCGDEFIGNDVEDYNFCPNCGADMRKGEKE